MKEYILFEKWKWIWTINPYKAENIHVEMHAEFRVEIHMKFKWYIEIIHVEFHVSFKLFLIKIF